MKLHHWILTLLCSMLFATSSQAEEGMLDELPWYEVEVIIFTRDLHPARLNEEWPEDPGAPDFSRAQPLQAALAEEIQPEETLNEEESKEPNSALENNLPAPGITTIDASELPVPITQRLPVPYTLIPEDEHRLKTEYKRLQGNNNLQPVVHLAWRQPVRDQQHSKLLYLRTPGAAPNKAAEIETISELESINITEPPTLEGTIRVSVNRYLHVELDLLNRIKQAPLYSSYEQSYGDSLAQQSQAYNRYRMQAHRRMRSGELHYIDHPLMGALIKITPFELPKPIPIAPVEPETTENPETAQPPQAEGVVVTEPTDQEASPNSKKQDMTTTTIEIPARKAE